MDSLVLLCAHRIIAQRRLPDVPTGLYPVLFQAAFQDGRTRVVRDLVTTWPFPELNLQRLVGRWELLPGHTCIKSVQAIIEAVVAQLWRELEEPWSQYRSALWNSIMATTSSSSNSSFPRCDFSRVMVNSSFSSLRTLDITGLPDSMSSCTRTGMTIWSNRELAKACLEVSKYQQEFQRCGSIWHDGLSGDATATAQPPGVDIHADLCVDRSSYEILRDALQIGATCLLRLKCREFKAEKIFTSEVVTLLESLDPSCLRRMDLRIYSFGLIGLLEILPLLSRFPELRSLKLENSSKDVQSPTPESAIKFLLWAEQAVMRKSSWPSGNLRQTLSFQAPALKRLDLSKNDISQGLLEPLQLLLEEISASLLHLDLTSCDMADSHLAALLPTLLRCSCLRFLGLHGNFLSTAAIKDLLQKTLELPDLHLVVYPFPVDCYKLARLESGFDFVTDEEFLAAATAEFSQILANSGRTDLNWTYNPNGHEALD